MKGRDAEHGHDRVADELLDRSPVTLEDGLHLLEVARHDTAERLRVESLSERRRPGHVGEEDGDGLAHLPSSRGRQHRAAAAAEAKALRILMAAARAPDHAQSVRRKWPD